MHFAIRRQERAAVPEIADFRFLPELRNDVSGTPEGNFAYGDVAERPNVPRRAVAGAAELLFNSSLIAGNDGPAASRRILRATKTVGQALSSQNVSNRTTS
jgi:hypothetical protein